MLKQPNEMKKYIRPQSTVLDIKTEGLMATSDPENLGGSVHTGTVTDQDDYSNKYIWDNPEWTEE